MSYGLIALIVGTVGSVWAGFYAGRLIARGRGDSPLRITFYGTLVLGPLAVLMPLLDNAYVALALVIPITFFMAAI